MAFHYLLALHIIFIVTWFAGLFYIVRLFVYHAETVDMPEPEKSILRKQYRLMERRLWYGITWPSMILSLLTGSWLALQSFSAYVQQPWFILKMCFVGVLVLYHLQNHFLFTAFRDKDAAWSSFRLRIWNEVATLLLFAIVFLVVPKSNSGWVWMGIGLVALAAGLYIGVQLYKKNREK
ncbi:MAG: CopD family protein [Bacteroidia bacterium]|nr:CopD family protein [Bacteroidia bacterium]